MLPLRGTRILAFEQYGAGPFGTQYLADLGAEVIKVEQAKSDGDYARALGPYFVDGENRHSASSLFFQTFNGNKKSITLDFTTDAGREVLNRLVKTADATADNLRGDVPAKLGITYDTLGRINPRIVCAHCSAYGRTGSRAHWPGYDYLMQAEAGYFQICGEPDAAPTRFGLSIVDYMGGMSMALGLVSAVLGARSTGKGRDVDVNLFDTAVYNLTYLASWSLNSDYEPGRNKRSAHPSMVPCQLYKTRDGWIYLMCNKESFWPGLCHAMGASELAENERYQTFADRLKHRDELTEVIDGYLSTRTTAEWQKLFEGKIPATAVLSPREAMENPFVQERDGIQTRTDQTGAEFTVLRPPIDTGDTPRDDTAAPQLGEHTDDLLREIGYTTDDIEALRKNGTV